MKITPFFIDKDTTICYNNRKKGFLVSKIKDKFVSLKNRLGLKGHKRAYSFVIAGVIVLVLAGIWFFGTPTGQLAQYSFFKSFNDIPEEHVIEVYSGNTKIKEYVGYYRVEQYQGYYTILSETTHERIDIYGCAVIVNEMKDFSEVKGDINE